MPKGEPTNKVRVQNYYKRHDPKAKDRPWSEMPKRVRQIPNYELPHPYKQSKLWHPGDASKGYLHTGERAAPEKGVPRVRTMIYPSDSGHHPYGPSGLEVFSPQHGGCGNAMPHGGTSPQAEEGSTEHLCTVDGNLERVGGIVSLEQEVLWARESIAAIYEEGFIDQKFGGRENRKFDGTEYVETCMGIEGLNFGTVDRLRFSADGTRAAIIDLKFGRWPPTLPPRNLQLYNYAVYAFFLNLPMPHSVTVYLLHAKTRKIYAHTYWRRSCYLMKARIAKIIARAERGKTDPSSVGYYPNPRNCGWCERINCPARLDLAGSLVSLWSKKPIVLPTPDLLSVSTEQLAILKTFVNALQRLIDTVNDECRRRAFDANDIVEGYEIKSRSGRRRIVGAANISEACNIVMREWPRWFPDSPLDLSNVALDLAELGVDDIEAAAGRAAPFGKILRAKELVGQLLDNPALVQNNKQFYLAAKIPTEKI